MSSRHLKKVFGSQKEELGLKLNVLDKDDDEVEEDEPIPIISTSRGRGRNANFALLNQFSEGLSENGMNDPGDSEDSASPSATAKNNEAEAEGSESASGQVTKKKRKKRKKKKNQIPAEAEEPQPSTSQSTSSSASALNFPQKEKEEEGESFVIPNTCSYHNSVVTEESRRMYAEFERLFVLDARLLNPQLELKKIFGINALNTSGRGGKYSQRRASRLSKLVSPKDHWTPTQGTGVSMKYLGDVCGISYFKYHHNEVYQDVQLKFLFAVDTLNPDNIMGLLQSCPYHIDSRIQLSDLAKNGEDVQVAADLVEGAIYCMESAFDSRFSLTNITSRLEYKYQENRAFHILLFKHLMFVGQRACYRTALELCKRLLLLDAEQDPLCVTLMIDFYAVKSGEYRWFVDLYKFWEPTRNLSQLPNWAYSVALAKFLLSRELTLPPKKKEGKGRKAFVMDNKKPSEQVEMPGASGESANAEAAAFLASADELIQYALLMFPAVFLPLMDKCGIHPEPRVMGHQFFNKYTSFGKTSPLKVLCDLYVWRNHHLWKDREVVAWLERNVNEVLVKVDRKDPIVEDYSSKRRRRYGKTPRNILRHLILTGNNDYTGHIANQLNGEAYLGYDPLPPHDTIDIYTPKAMATTRSLHSGGFLSSLFRSILHDMNAPQPNDEELHRQLHGNGPDPRDILDGLVEPDENPTRAGLQQSVAALLDSMRELLTNLRPEGGNGEGANAEAEADGEEDNEDEDEEDLLNID